MNRWPHHPGGPDAELAEVIGLVDEATGDYTAATSAGTGRWVRPRRRLHPDASVRRPTVHGLEVTDEWVE